MAHCSMQHAAGKVRRRQRDGDGDGANRLPLVESDPGGQAVHATTVVTFAL